MVKKLKVEGRMARRWVSMGSLEYLLSFFATEHMHTTDKCNEQWSTLTNCTRQDV